jgi:hypothetical protein
MNLNTNILALSACQARLKKHEHSMGGGLRREGGGGETQKTIKFLWQAKFHPVFHFCWPERLQCCLHILFTDSTCTIIIISLEPCFNISYPDLIKFPYFIDTTERVVRAWKYTQRQGKGWVTLRIFPLMYHSFYALASSRGQIKWWPRALALKVSCSQWEGEVCI